MEKMGCKVGGKIGGEIFLKEFTRSRANTEIDRTKFEIDKG